MPDQSLTQETTDTEAASLRSPVLSRADWLRAALETLIESGADAVKITRLADRLGVTRGSFYWHFKDRGEILEALIDSWAQKNTVAIVNAAGAGPDLTGSVLALMMAWLDAGLYDPRLDFSIRAWARSDAALRARVLETDETRLAALAQMYQRAGRSPEAAEVAARNLYYMQMGYYALGVSEALATRLSYIRGYFTSFTGEALPEARLKRFLEEVAQRPGIKDAG
ncbi:TetR/AcrR family transcriptional regulator [Falsigemmobacter intermedius]|nr:TetR/AcrR family transcriptional regulator [Falsigemmobacter intermedius]